MSHVHRVTLSFSAAMSRAEAQPFELDESIHCSNPMVPYIQLTIIICSQGVVLWEPDQIIERWKGYFGKLLNKENPRTVFGDGVPNEGLTPAINRKEVEVALKGMKHGKAMGPGGIPVEV